jgi:hypothetical protein
MRTIKLLTIGGLLTLGACAAPAISDIATDKVKVQSEDGNITGASAEAARRCAIYNRFPVLLSKRRIRTGGLVEPTEFLFACLDAGQAKIVAGGPAS